MKYIVSILMIVFFCQCELYCPSQTVSQEELDQCNSDDEGWTPCNKGTVDFVTRERLLDRLSDRIVSHKREYFYRITDPIITLNGNVSVQYKNYQTGSRRVVTYVPARDGSGFSDCSKIITCFYLDSSGKEIEYGHFTTDPSRPPCFIYLEGDVEHFPNIPSYRYY